MEQGRSLEIGFTSNNLPLAKGNFSEDTESQYADELRRQAYIQTLGRLIFTICIKFMCNIPLILPNINYTFIAYTSNSGLD